MVRDRILLAAAFFSSTTFAAVPPTPEPSSVISLAQAEPSATAGKREPRRAPTEEESLALAALEGLMSQPPERALPMLRKVLGGSQSTLVKRRALFVLSQIDTSEAQALLLDTARTGDPALRSEAIRNIGISGNPTSLAVLQQIYDTGDAKVKKQVMQAWLISGRKAEVYQAAVNAKSEEDANNAIRTLSVMGARDELRKLGETRQVNNHLVEAYAISGDVESLLKIVEGKGDASARRDAVRKIGIVHSEEARTALREIYSSSQDADIRDAALQGMLIGNDEQGLLTLYRASKNAEEKRALLRTLSMMNSDAALQAIDAALEGKR
jgi:HEAT repeat protein